MSIPEPVLDRSFDDTIIIDGLPKADATKQEKLVAFVKKKFEAYKPVDAELPIGEDGNALGFIFMRCETPEFAKQAVAQMNGKPMDRVHIFSVDLFATPDASANIPDTYVPLNEDSLDVKPLPYLQDYLLDPAGREQVLLRFRDSRGQDQTHVCFTDPHDENFLVRQYEAAVNEGPQILSAGNKAAFSPKGTFLYTHHPKGLKIFGGSDYTLCSKINHPGVLEVSFSPCERYIVTMSEQPAPSVLCDVAVWELAAPQAPVVRYNTILRNQPWPFFKWSQDGRYFARVANKKEEIKDKSGQINVKLTPMGILVFDMDKKENIGAKPIPAPNLVAFEFSPTSNLLAFFTLGKELLPSRTVVFDVNARRELRANPAFGVESCNLVWHPSGEYLLTQIDRRVDKVKIQSILSVYLVTKKNIPTIEHPLTKPPSTNPKEKDLVHFPISRVQCSPTLPMILTTTFKPIEKRPEVEFAIWTFSETAVTQAWHLSIPIPSGVPLDNLQELEKTFETAWSPIGDVFYFAVFSKLDGNVTVVDCSKSQHIAVLATDLCLSQANTISWDYSGRQFALGSLRSTPKNNRVRKPDEVVDLLSRLQFYSFQGQMLFEIKFPELASFAWRPQPIVSLTTEEQAHIKTNLRENFWNKFSTFDDNNALSRNSVVIQRRNELKSKWKELRQICMAAYQATRQDRLEAYGGYCSDDENDEEYEMVEIGTVEQVLEVKKAPE